MSCFCTFCAYDWTKNVCGPTTWLMRLLPALRDAGLDVKCLVLVWDQPGPLIDFLRENEIDHSILMCKGDSHSRAQWILQQLKLNTPHVFIPNLVVPALHAARWVRAAGIPTIGVLHSDDRFYHAVRDVFALGRPADALSHLVCVSRELERQTNELNPPNTLVKRIPYGVPVPLRSVRRHPTKLRIAYVGRLAEEQKQIGALARSLCSAVTKLPGVSASIFGDGPDRSVVEQILATTGTGLPVRLVGRVDSQDIQNHMLDHDVIVLLSDYEGLPIAILEAMACGVVPVCLNMRSGISELIEHGVNGLIVENRDDAFVAAIERLQDDVDLWQRLSTHARQRIVTDYSVESSNAQWIDLIQEAASHTPANPQLQLPVRLDLASVHPDLAAEDPRANDVPGRKKSFPRRLCRYIKRFLSRRAHKR